MAVERPTFSESWYRVGHLRPRLRATVQVHRQHYRGQLWQVLQDPAGNQFFRLNEPAYHFVAMLDGKRTVADVWRACNEVLGDLAPTQNEAIHLLGQLYVSNLLSAELPPDAQGLFSRYRKRKMREVQSYMMSLLFIRIPLIDPDRFLDRWVGVFGLLFTKVGLGLWAILIATGLYFAFSNVRELTATPMRELLNADNLPWLYAGMVLAKVFHEFGHAFVCKKFGRHAGGGEVHVMGVMFLVFMPLPYVDASSAWAFRSKWRRAIVGAAGMFVELAIAAVAAIIWANVDEGTTKTVCYNIMFVASISSLLFNGNALLRYDAYYILSDLLEIPNLAQRSKEYIYYLVKRYAWGVRRLRNPAHSAGEKFWFCLYGPASTMYRVFIFSMILLFVTERLPRPLAVVAVGFAMAAAITWLGVPAWKFFHYLTTSPELMRNRPRAGVTTAAALALVLGFVGLIPVPDRTRVTGVIEPVRMAVVRAEANGFVREFLPTGEDVTPDGPVLLTCENVELNAQARQMAAERRRLRARRLAAGTQEPAAVQVLDREIAALDKQIAYVDRQIAALAVKAPLAGRWISPHVDRLQDAYVKRGDSLGLVVDLSDLIIRAVVEQDDVAAIFKELDVGDEVEVRLRRQPAVEVMGRIKQRMPAGSKKLPSAALGYSAGGPVAVDTQDPKGTTAAERFFEILITPQQHPAFKTGQRVIVRFTMPRRPLALQGWRSLRRLFQRRFKI